MQTHTSNEHSGIYWKCLKQICVIWQKYSRNFQKCLIKSETPDVLVFSCFDCNTHRSFPENWWYDYIKHHFPKTSDTTIPKLLRVSSGSGSRFIKCWSSRYPLVLVDNTLPQSLVFFFWTLDRGENRTKYYVHDVTRWTSQQATITNKSWLASNPFFLQQIQTVTTHSNFAETDM